MEDYTTALPAGATQVTSLGLGVGPVLFSPNFEDLKKKETKQANKKTRFALDLILWCFISGNMKNLGA